MSNDKAFYNDIARSNNFSVSATNSEATYPVSNIVTETVSNTWRSTGIGDIYITFDGGAAAAIKGIALLNINTDEWATIEAQSSDDDFATAPSETQAMTITSRTFKKYDREAKRIIDNIRHDAYCIVNWSRQDYRIKLNSTAVSFYESGRVYIFTDIYEFERSSEYNVPAGLVTVSTNIDGASGQKIKIPQYQRFQYDMQFGNISKFQADKLSKELALNPTFLSFVDGEAGELIYGNVEFGLPRAYGLVFSDDRIFLNGIFTESL